MTKSSVWETLSKINVNDHTEKKNGLTYLSWAWAWGVLKDNYPSATFEKHIQPNGMPYITDHNGYAYVQVTVTVEGISATELFPVLDYKNKSIKDPDSFSINTSMQRALAKAISYHGLGHYIYAGEDIPQTDDAPQKPAEARQSASASVGVVGAQAKATASTGPAKGAVDIPPVRGKDGDTKVDGYDMAADVLATIIRTMCKTEDDLRETWSKNGEVLAEMKKMAPSLYEEMVEVFKSKKLEIKGDQK